MKRFFGFLLMLLTVVAVSAKDIKTVSSLPIPNWSVGSVRTR